MGHRGSCCVLCQSVLPMYSSKSSVTPGLTVMSLIHFEFILVYGAGASRQSRSGPENVHGGAEKGN